MDATTNLLKLLKRTGMMERILSLGIFLILMTENPLAYVILVAAL